jgi:Response regulator containing a CheY-like receiver domain and an HTH DNA-binding domain
MPRINILIVEDDPDWIKAMTGFLNRENDLAVIAAAPDKDTAVQLCKTLDLDIVLMDINLSANKYDGILAAAEINQIKKVKIIMLTSLADADAITNSFTAGAVNYISKNNYREIPKVIRETHRNHTPIEVLLQEYHRLKEAEQLQDLTPAEKEIYFLIESGHTQAQIARQLYKSENTIKNQVNHILKKLKVSNCREAVRKVKSKGLLN